MIEVRLVKVTTRKSDLDPVNRVLLVNRADDLLKSLDAAIQFRRQPDFILKKLYTAPLTEIDALGNLGARTQTGLAFKLTNRKRHRRVMLQRTRRDLHQPLFEDTEFHLDSLCLVEQPEKAAGRWFSPQIIQRDAEIVKLSEWKSKKRECAASLEVNA